MEHYDIYSAVGTARISDALDQRGLFQQVLRPGFVPVSDDCMIVGLARTLSSQPRSATFDEGREYELLIESIDDLGPGDVLVTDTMDCCVWGELCSERAMARGSNGAVIDGYHRDTRLIRQSGFSVLSRGPHVADLLYRRQIIKRDQSVVCGGVTVSLGDLIVADVDGVVVVPAPHVAAVAEQAAVKADAEMHVRSALRGGASVREVWDTYKVL